MLTDAKINSLKPKYNCKLPEHIALNHHIYLKKIALQHSLEMFQQIARHREFLSNYVHWTRFTHKLEDTQNFIQLCIKEAEAGESFVWAICVENRCVGTISLNKPIDWQNRIALIGYWLSPEMQGQGIVTQAVNKLIEETKPLFNRYILCCATHNERSNVVAKRCGFEFIETKQEAEKIGDVFYPQHIYYKDL